MNESIDVRQPDRRLFAAVATLFTIIVVVGFGRTYYLRFAFAQPPLPSLLVHAHGLLMTAWVALFATQVWLIRARRVAVHRTLGALSVGLAIPMVLVGVGTAIAAARFGSSSTPPDVPPLAFLIVPLTDMVLFVGLYAAAILQRARPANHKRLMLLTALNFLPPALARIPLPWVQLAGPLVFFGVPAALAMGLLIYDTRRSGRVNVAFAAGALVLIASFPLRLALSGTDAWMRVATWLTSGAA